MSKCDDIWKIIQFVTIMKIVGISVYQVSLPLVDGSYKWADGKGVKEFDSTVVQIETDAGITGYGEVCPLGSNYLPAYANGVRTGLKELCPQLIGEDPQQLAHINTTMDYQLRGHPYVKSAIDIACWDILGKVTKQPVCVLLGGRFGKSVQLYRAITQDTPENMRDMVLRYRDQGYKKFQLKVGGSYVDDINRISKVREALDPSDVLVADANTGWLRHDAMKVVQAVSNLDVYIEQPCESYKECLSVRNHTNLPFILDENMNDVPSLLRAHTDKAADVVNIKISKFGGLTKAKQARDLCVTLGTAMTLEDTWGSDIVTASIAHLNHSTPEKFRFSMFDVNSYNTVHVANGVPEKYKGTMKAPCGPGLGIEPNMDVLGKPVIKI